MRRSTNPSWFIVGFIATIVVRERLSRATYSPREMAENAYRNVIQRPIARRRAWREAQSSWARFIADLPVTEGGEAQ